MNERLAQLVRELFEIVDKVECSDSGRFFHPTTLEFSSCRTSDGIRVGKIFDEMKAFVNAPARMSEKELYVRNNPTGCGECLGKGVGCRACGGSGSIDPTVAMICIRCKGTGDTQNHERETNNCPVCMATGRVRKCNAPACMDPLIDCKRCEGTGFLPV